MRKTTSPDLLRSAFDYILKVSLDSLPGYQEYADTGSWPDSISYADLEDGKRHVRLRLGRSPLEHCINSRVSILGNQFWISVDHGSDNCLDKWRSHWDPVIKSTQPYLDALLQEGACVTTVQRICLMIGHPASKHPMHFHDVSDKICHCLGGAAFAPSFLSHADGMVHEEYAADWINIRFEERIGIGDIKEVLSEWFHPDSLVIGSPCVLRAVPSVKGVMTICVAIARSY